MWFARDKGANYGFCEIASQEEWVTLLSDSRRLNDVHETRIELGSQGQKRLTAMWPDPWFCLVSASSSCRRRSALCSWMACWF